MPKSSFFTSLISLPKISFFLGMMIIIWGFVSYLTIPKENAPYIAYGIVTISTPYTGVSAKDINDLVTEKIETKIKNITGVNSYSSVSQSGMSNISIEFEPDIDMIKAVSDVRSKVAESKSSLPSDLDNDPIITEIDSTLAPFLTVVLSGNFSQIELHDKAKELEKMLERVNGVSQINIIGGAERQMKVELDMNKMKALGLSIEEVMNTLRNANKDIPVGNVDIGEKTYIVRFEGKFSTVEDVQNLVMKNFQNNPNENASLIPLKEIATISEAGKDDPIITQFTNKKNNGNTDNAIFLNISRNTSGDIFSTDAKTRKAIEEYTAEKFPKTLSVSYANEVLPNIEKSFLEVFRVGYEAIFIVMLIIFLFVGVVEGIISALIIPITVLFTIGILSLMGASLNFMTNFSMILALGILVDNAIVIVQGTHLNIQKGMTSSDAATKAVEDFKAPLIAGTLTTLAVFLPLLSLPGMLGKYLSFIPITVSIALSSSLIIALFFISSYTASILPIIEKWSFKKNKFSKMLDTFRAKIDYFIDHIYGNFIASLLHSRTIRLGMILCSIVLLTGSMMFPIPSTQFPTGDSEILNITIKKPVGTQDSVVQKEIISLEKNLLSFPESKQISTTIENETASIVLELLTKEEREDKNMRTSQELEKEILKFLPTLHNTENTLTSKQKGPPSDSPVAFRVIVNNSSQIETAKQVTKDLTTIMKTMDGATGVGNNIKEIPGEFRFTVDRDKAIRLGIAPESVGMTIRNMVSGSIATTITRNGNDIDVIVQSKKIDDIKSIPLLSQSGNTIPLGEVISEAKENAVERMYREDGDLAFTISAFLGTAKDGKPANAEKITKEFKEKIGSYAIPKGILVKDAGESASNEDLQKALLVGGVTALLLMYFVVFFQFQSFLQPIIILQTIIFAQIGVNLGLYLFDIPKSMAYTLGLITLFGIIVNHTIILIDQINKNRRMYGEIISYEEVISAVVEGCKSRFHPVMMTGMATIAGLFPLLSVDEFWYGLASTIIFGLMTATILVFFVTPATYIQLEKEKWTTFGWIGITIIIVSLLTALI